MPAQATTSRASQKPGSSTEKPKAPAPPQKQEDDDDDDSEEEEEDTEAQVAAKREKKILDYKTDPIFRIRNERDYENAVKKGGVRRISTAWYFQFKGQQADKFMVEMAAVNGPPVSEKVVQHHLDQIELQKFNEMLSKSRVPGVSEMLTKAGLLASGSKSKRTGRSTNQPKRQRGNNQSGGRNGSGKGIWISTRTI